MGMVRPNVDNYHSRIVNKAHNRAIEEAEKKIIQVIESTDGHFQIRNNKKGSI